MIFGILRLVYVFGDGDSGGSRDYFWVWGWMGCGDKWDAAIEY